MVASIENGAVTFQWANDAENTTFWRMWFRVPARTLSSTAGIAGAINGPYTVAPPLEAAFGIDAAMKSANVQLVTYVPPPSETNYSAAFLAGGGAACKAACNAFTDAVLDIAVTLSSTCVTEAANDQCPGITGGGRNGRRRRCGGCHAESNVRLLSHPSARPRRSC